jgi:plasmid maintenance system antidote protein VapI
LVVSNYDIADCNGTPISISTNGQRSITGDTALRLAHFFGGSAESG